jgi:hypothetical protein
VLNSKFAGGLDGAWERASNSKSTPDFKIGSVADDPEIRFRNLVPRRRIYESRHCLRKRLTSLPKAVPPRRKSWY